MDLEQTNVHAHRLASEVTPDLEEASRFEVQWFLEGLAGRKCLSRFVFKMVATAEARSQGRDSVGSEGGWPLYLERFGELVTG